MTPERFMDYVMPIPETGCWLWLGGLDGSGYGMLSDELEQKAHRYSFHTFKHSIPANRVVMHSCDIKCCVNPAHLSVGTYRDNALDASSKGKLFNTSPWQAGTGSKMTAESVRDVRHRVIDLHESPVSVAKLYGINSSSISKIINGRTWRHIQ